MHIPVIYTFWNAVDQKFPHKIHVDAVSLVNHACDAIHLKQTKP